jgi:hypothetical protein
MILEALWTVHDIRNQESGLGGRQPSKVEYFHYMAARVTRGDERLGSRPKEPKQTML